MSSANHDGRQFYYSQKDKKVSYNPILANFLRSCKTMFIHMNTWTSLPTKEKSYSYLNMESITDIYNKNAKGVSIDFEIKIVDEYYEIGLKQYVIISWHFLRVFEISILKYRSLILLIFFHNQNTSNHIEYFFKVGVQ